MLFANREQRKKDFAWGTEGVPENVRYEALW